MSYLLIPMAAVAQPATCDHKEELVKEVNDCYDLIFNL